jgi:hypothetical protein
LERGYDTRFDVESQPMRFGLIAPRASAFASACAERLGASPEWWHESAPRDAAPVDFVLDLAAAPGAGSPARACRSRFGSWRFDLAGAGAWAVDAVGEGRAAVEARLCAAADDRDDVVLQRGWLPLSPGVARTRSVLSSVLACWPARAASEIEAGAWEAFPRHAVAAPSAPHRSRNGRARVGLMQPMRSLAHWWRTTTRYDTWNVGIAPLERPLGRIDDLSLAGRPVRWLPERPPLHFVADPFPLRDGDRDFLLVEECGHQRSLRGRICRLDLAAPDVLLPVIESSGHLSYPFVFRDGVETWCAPEMSSARGVTLHRLELDGRWRPAHHLLGDRRVVDPTFFRKDGRWWLFFTSYTGREANLSLHACWAEQLAGPWRPHAQDPLKWDLGSARPAGPPFTLGGALYRPAQDCRETYGGAVQVMEILELSPDRFREAAVRRLEPDPAWPYPDGLHHLVVESDRLVFDAKRRRYDNLLWIRTALR